LKRFAELFRDLEASNRTEAKLRALERYFAEASAEDAAWGLAFLIGQRPRRAVNSTLLRAWVAEEAGLAPWLVDECYDVVGDLAETLALLLPEDPMEGAAERDAPALAAFVERYVLGLADLEEDERRERIREAWSVLPASERFLFHKLLTGGFRVGVQKTLVARALARFADLEPQLVTQRLMGGFETTPEAFHALIAPDDGLHDPGRPYPFCLAHPVPEELESIGAAGDYQVEWKWDGIRAQLVRRMGEWHLWTRGEELVTPRYPELAEAALELPEGTVLDGELVAWSEGVLPFHALQRRLGRKTVGPKLLKEVPVVFLAYDLLEAGGVDLRAAPTADRRRALEALVRAEPGAPIGLSPLVGGDTWVALAEQRARSREANVEGLMLKHVDAPYTAGRKRGLWWKWKVDPFSVDAVLINAQKGHGRRSNLFSDYTFAVWRAGELVPIAKAYSGLTDKEIAEVDRFVRKHTLERFGPVRAVEPELVFELHFEGLQPSKRHKAGLALRFPRMHRWRKDKLSKDADSLELLERWLAETEVPR
jgi:DNA ligase-1